MSKLRAFVMPKWGIEMIEGKVSEWSVKEGDRVAKGQTIVLIETDKIVNEVEAEFETRFVRLLATAGETYPVGALLGVIATEDVTTAEVDAFIRDLQRPGSDVASPAAAPASPAAAPASPPAPAPGKAPSPVAPIAADLSISPAARAFVARTGVDPKHLKGSGRRGRITLQDAEQASRPARSVGGGDPIAVLPTTANLDGFYASIEAKRLAFEHHIDLASLRGTGPRGRVTRDDVAQAAGIVAPVPGAGAGSGAEVIRMSPMRKAIARQLTLSKTSVPHYYLRLQVNLDALMALRSQAKQRHESAPSLNDYLLRATALALIAVPDVNIQVHGEEIHRFAHANISVAVATDRGLVTPVLRSAETKSVAAIAAELGALAQLARVGRLRAEQMEGGSFTVSNLGMFGVEQFDAIINVPQGAILAIGAARRGVVERNGTAVFASLAALSLSLDHRAIDGAVGAKFLTTLRELIEAPERL